MGAQLCTALFSASSGMIKICDAVHGVCDMQILETKVRKLEQLVRLKDAKIATLMAKLQAAGLA